MRGTNQRPFARRANSLRTPSTCDATATMGVRLYNTRTRKKEAFAPLTPGFVKMYVCGPTTYDYSHLGHARSYIDFDVARRYLEYLGHRVTYVVNFTDIEEVIIRRAKAVGKDPLVYAQFYIDAFLDDMRALNVRPADHMPKVSGHIREITALVRRLIDRGYAYSVDGEVYFRTRKAKHSFGILTHQKFADIVVEPPAGESPKEDPLDFALWKKSKGDEPSWPSPRGDGRPGWHVECNAIANKYLGAPLDIHGGGVDLKFPHHESEAVIGAAKTASGPGSGGKVDALVARTRDGFRAAMDDDLNTRDAIFRLQQLTEAIVEIPTMSASEGRAVVGAFRESGQILGLFPDLG